jgi:hypothetical protein
LQQLPTEGVDKDAVEGMSNLEKHLEGLVALSRPATDARTKLGVAVAGGPTDAKSEFKRGMTAVEAEEYVVSKADSESISTSRTLSESYHVTFPSIQLGTDSELYKLTFSYAGARAAR